MSVIVNIQPQAFELVRDQIVNILSDEIFGQLIRTGNYDLDLTVWRERSITFDFEEIAAVNVIFGGVPYDSQNAQQQSGTYTYFIDCYQKAKAQENSLPDTRARVKLHKLLGICRSILMDSRYKTLGFEPPFIDNRVVQSINISDEDRKNNDATTTVVGRIVLNVRMREITEHSLPPKLQDFLSNIRLVLTDIGYIWEQSST